jgi:hypothetical protein
VLHPEDVVRLKGFCERIRIRRVLVEGVARVVLVPNASILTRIPAAGAIPSSACIAGMHLELTASACSCLR